MIYIDGATDYSFASMSLCRWNALYVETYKIFGTSEFIGQYKKVKT